MNLNIMILMRKSVTEFLEESTKELGSSAQVDYKKSQNA